MTETAPRSPDPTVALGNPGPHPAPSRPRLLLPPGATDAHCHVFGPAEVYPYAEDRTFTPVDAPLEEVVGRQRFLGLERAVIVQSSCYGTDHRVLLDALASDPDGLRGVALVDDTVSRAELRELDEAGVCGARLHFLPHLGADPDSERIGAVVRTVADLGWHAELHVHGDGIRAQAELIAAMPTTVVIDHLARVDLREGLHGPAVQALLALLDRGHVWVKLSGADRVSRTGPPYADAAALGALLAERFPERVVWGTDYPHVNIAGAAPDDGELVDLLARIAPSEELRQRVLVTNPSELFGFAPVLR